MEAVLGKGDVTCRYDYGYAATVMRIKVFFYFIFMGFD